jgi:hypothetical protein
MEVTYMLGLLKILSMFTVTLGTVVPVIADGNMTTNRDKIADDSEVDINKVFQILILPQQKQTLLLPHHN